MVTVKEGDAFVMNLVIGTVLYVVVELLDDERAVDRRVKCLRFATDDACAHLLIRREDYLTAMLKHNEGNVRVAVGRRGDRP